MDSFNLLYDQGLSTTALDFLESSSMNIYNLREIGERIHGIMKSPYYSKQVIGHTYEHGITEKLKLQPVYNKETSALINIQLQRKTTRLFKQYIHLHELAACLLSAYFITEKFEQHSHHLARRSIASGGALYPIDLYYISLHTEGLENAVYCYNPHEECLEKIKSFSSDKLLYRSLQNIYPADILGSWDMHSLSGILVFGAVLNRVSCKYGDRGLRFALIDVGSICQNIHLSAAATKISCCAIGGYMDRELDRFMDFQSPNETALLTMFIGKES